MKKSLSTALDEVAQLVERKGSITLSELESSVDASYNLIFLALDSMVMEKKIRIDKRGREYVISRASI